ncbi:MAG TPA: UDP-N-acetylmuramoyl-L-alanine--D-glutamate ligase [Gammaproteobacteria bacterium]|nr:UDP-N-acetylmuramoyl-L-alanine--D-glutamate ligase [Gammaproteobacteria bacterium]
MTSAAAPHPDPFAAARAELAGRRVAVVGAGGTGRSAVRFLHGAGARVALTDSRAEPPGLAGLSEVAPADLALGGLDGALLAAQELVVVSPGVPLDDPAIAMARAAGATIIGDVELFGRYAGAPVVAVTGSNGKSTVTSLLGAMFAAAGPDAGVGGNLGTPALDLLAMPEPPAYVLEISSFQAEGLARFRPRVAVLLNLSPDHLDRYPDLASYYAAKWRLFQGMGAGDTAVLNADDPEVVGGAAQLPPGVRPVWFGSGLPAAGGAGVVEQDGEPWFALGTETGPQAVLPVARWPLEGGPNRANALAALAAGAAAGLSVEAMARALAAFNGLGHRMEVVAEVAGVRYINDSKGTNVGAVAAALAGLDRPFVWIAGGVDKDSDFSELAPVLRQGAREAVLIGEAADEIAAAVDGAVTVYRAGTMAAAVRRAAEVARSGEAVVLSPACTSFDQYPDFAARGEDFRRQVQALQGGRHAG